MYCILYPETCNSLINIILVHVLVLTMTYLALWPFSPYGISPIFSKDGVHLDHQVSHAPPGRRV